MLPSALSWPSGRVGGWLTNSWDNPGCHYDLQTYAWPRQVETLMKALLLAYHKTGQAKYLDPILAAANGIKNGDEGSWEYLFFSSGVTIFQPTVD